MPSSRQVWRQATSHETIKADPLLQSFPLNGDPRRSEKCTEAARSILKLRPISLNHHTNFVISLDR